MSRKKAATPEFDSGYPKKKPKPSYTLNKVGFRTKRQEVYYNSIMENVITVSTGPAGTGKSYIAVYAALQCLAAGEVSKIIMTKPVVEIGNSLGALPGDVDEKMAPYVRSIEECIADIIGEAGLNNLISRKQLEILPLNYVRGLTIKDAFVIADEMQNATYAQTKALLTRIGEDAVYVINGDLEQSDLKANSGLPAAIQVLDGIEGVGSVEFTIDDIVRSGICKDIIINYHHLEKNMD